MEKKKVIAIVCGGDSSEHDVSLRSAQGIYSFIDKERFEVYVVELKGLTWEAHLEGDKRVPVSREDFSFKVGRRIVKPDFAYITIHGTPGEDGTLQGYFDLIRMPYSTSGVLVESMTFNKFTPNQYLKGFGVSVSESLVVRKGSEDLVTDGEIIDHGAFPRGPRQRRRYRRRVGRHGADALVVRPGREGGSLVGVAPRAPELARGRGRVDGECRRAPHVWRPRERGERHGRLS